MSHITSPIYHSYRRDSAVSAEAPLHIADLTPPDTGILQSVMKSRVDLHSKFYLQWIAAIICRSASPHASATYATDLS